MSGDGVDDTEVEGVRSTDGAQLALVSGGSSNDDDHADLTLVVPMKLIEEAVTGNQRPLIQFYEEHKAGTRPKPKAVSKDREEQSERDIAEVFEFHTEKVWGRSKRGKRPALKPAMHRIIRRQLVREGHSVDDLKHAIEGALMDPWYCGDNPQNKEYLGIDSIFRLDGRVQRFIDAYSTSDDGHTNVRNVHEKREETRLKLREIAAKMRNHAASLEDKGRFSTLLAELRKMGETYSWETDKFTKL